MTVQARASRLSFSDILKRLAALPPTEPIFISKQVPNNQLCRLITYHTGDIQANLYKLYGLRTINSHNIIVSTLVYMQNVSDCIALGLAEP